MADHVVWDELAAGHALDALSPDEELTFTAHLETCAICQASVDDHNLVAAQLGAIAMPEVPLAPPSWASIRTAVIGATADDAAGRDDLPASVADMVDLGDRRRRYAGSRRVLAAAAAVVVIAVGGIVVWRTQSGSSSPGVSCGSTPGCHTVALDSTSGVLAASLTVQGDVITMTPTNMKPAPGGNEYVLWQLPADGRPIAVKVFTKTGSEAVARATTRVAYSDTTSFAVSQERSGPVPPSPTTPLLAVGTAT
jgi:anti-sigma-K factor RskA